MVGHVTESFTPYACAVARVIDSTHSRCRLLR